MARKDKHRWLFSLQQRVKTPMGDARIMSISSKVIQVKFTDPPKGGQLYEKFYLKPTYECQLSISQIRCTQQPK